MRLRTASRMYEPRVLFKRQLAAFRADPRGSNGQDRKGEVGRTYVREHLGNINVLCSALLETFDSAPGEVFTFAPADTPPERLSEFERGGLLPENLSGAGAVALPDGSTLVPVVSLIDKQINLLRETMEGAGGAICIVDDFNPRWSERPSYLGPSAFGVGEEVYHLLTLDDAEEEFLTAVEL